MLLLDLKLQTNSLGPGAYGYTDLGGNSKYPEPVIGGVTSGGSATGYASPFADSLASQRQDIAVGSSPGVMGRADIGHERANSLNLIRTAECDPSPLRESNVLFVDGLPTDCTRREVGRILAPYVLSFLTILLIFPTLKSSALNSLPIIPNNLYFS